MFTSRSKVATLRGKNALLALGAVAITSSVGQPLLALLCQKLDRVHVSGLKLTLKGPNQPPYKPYIYRGGAEGGMAGHSSTPAPPPPAEQARDETSSSAEPDLSLPSEQYTNDVHQIKADQLLTDFCVKSINIAPNKRSLAFKSFIRFFHPDMHPNADPETKKDYDMITRLLTSKRDYYVNENCGVTTKRDYYER